MYTAVLRIRPMAKPNTVRWMSGFRKILDLGGMPYSAEAAAPVRPVDISKNSRIHAAVFDFDLLTRAIHKEEPKEKKSKEPSAPKETLGDVQPDAKRVEKVAQLLNVDLGGEASFKTGAADDLTALSGEDQEEKKKKKKKEVERKSRAAPTDVRSKYASKLNRKVDMGLAGVEMAKTMQEEALKRGDAPGHIEARKIAVEHDHKGKKWMAKTGTGSLLSYLTYRSVKIALLPPLREPDPEEGSFPERMDEFSRQLHNVVIDVMLEGDDPTELIDKAVEELDVDVKRTLVVSDRDQYLQAAHDVGMLTCCVRPLNVRQGKVHANYNVHSVPDIQEVIDEINGISYNAMMHH